MNNPLRYHGETFYQSGFKPGDQTTILQIVTNPDGDGLTIDTGSGDGVDNGSG